MALHYLIDGAYVRKLDTAYTQGSHFRLVQWVNTSPKTRSVFSIRKNTAGVDEFYKLTASGWTTKGETREPKEVTMARTIDALSDTNWKEIEDEIQTDSLFTKR